MRVRAVPPRWDGELKDWMSFGKKREVWWVTDFTTGLSQTPQLTPGSYIYKQFSFNHTRGCQNPGYLNTWSVAVPSKSSPLAARSHSPSHETRTRVPILAPGYNSHGVPHPGSPPSDSLPTALTGVHALHVRCLPWDILRRDPSTCGLATSDRCRRRSCPTKTVRRQLDRFTGWS